MADMIETSVVSSKGQVTIPSFMRTKHNIKAGDKIIWEEFENRIALRKPLDFFSQGGSLHLGTIPDNEEDLLTPEMGNHMMERSYTRLRTRRIHNVGDGC
ncbi:MAG: AbrB/MazE/SpoVT family DNA-binding domain-containing protein [Acidobacteriota bacterium]|jgi:AbrB family looped-hinge helix DNA binding protein|nr:AbrB/MazE/SpoVT family DNA-binding domain-containing protein [Acidobacteriota bacterium]